MESKLTQTEIRDLTKTAMVLRGFQFLLIALTIGIFFNGFIAYGIVAFLCTAIFGSVTADVLEELDQHYDL